MWMHNSLRHPALAPEVSYKEFESTDGLSCHAKYKHTLWIYWFTYRIDRWFHAPNLYIAKFCMCYAMFSIMSHILRRSAQFEGVGYNII